MKMEYTIEHEDPKWHSKLSFKLTFAVMAGNAPAASASGLKLNYYSKSCPRAEQIIKEQVRSHYDEHGNTAVSWLRALFHDCTVRSCDA
ncbi:hypothetical protein QYE76_038523 [Lolium multiflorum]|uniref:Plant heme peroxidase family profile domain-containing protein n=1 Tax=Lolium multiflorum TaxID=4521 RepID=A0AAD8T7Q7_LOLMU|nr:hypothetical protein QYE76_038523 [Lolium multiflorum]